MNSFRCPNCGLTNFASDSCCKRCNASFQDSGFSYQSHAQVRRRVNTSQKKSNTWKLATYTLIGVLIGCLGIYFYLTPYLVMRDIQKAFVEKDAETVIAHIDFPVFKENIKAELNAQMASKTASDSQDNPFEKLGAMFAQNLVNTLVDSFVSPAGIEQLMKADSTSEANQTGGIPIKNALFNKELFDQEKVRIESAYDSFNQFVVNITNKEDLRWSNLTGHETLCKMR